MLTHKDIEKIRKMYQKQHYEVTEITRILKISRNTCYKYLKFVNFMFTGACRLAHGFAV